MASSREDWLRWMDAMAHAVDLPIAASSREGVAAQLELNRRLAAPLLDFELPADTPVDGGPGS